MLILMQELSERRRGVQHGLCMESQLICAHLMYGPIVLGLIFQVELSGRESVHFVVLADSPYTMGDMLKLLILFVLFAGMIS
jgi:hypothetical protein